MTADRVDEAGGEDAGDDARTGVRGWIPEAPRVPVPDADGIRLLRDDLTGYTVDDLGALLGPTATSALDRGHLLPASRRVASALRRGGFAGGPAALMALFMLSQALPRRQVEAALPRLGVDGAQRMGLVVASGHDSDDEVRPLVDLQPYAAVDAGGTAQWWIVSDLPSRPGAGPLPVDHVLGVGGASLMLAGSTIRRPVARVLDVGTGCGVQALHAARHASEVTGTDVSARALHFARFTWALNSGPDPDRPGPDGRTSRLQLRQGSLLEPVAGEEFDLVVSNPPFVITPRRAAVPLYEYRDGGVVGDELVRRLVTGVGAVLAPGGVAQLLGNWEHHRGQPWQERVSSWLEACGLDGWIVQREVQDAAEYAETWIRDGGQEEGQAFDALHDAWLDDFETRQVDAVGFGLITLRRPADGGPGTLRRVEEIRTPAAGPLGGHLEACLAAEDWLRAEAATDGALAAARLRVAADVTEERHYRPGDEDPQVIVLRQGGGFGRGVRASTALAGLVGACDGELTVGRLIAALAELLGVPADGLASELLPAVRRLVADGLLVPPSG